MKFTDYCNKTIAYSFYTLFFLVPLLFLPYNYELFEYNKMMLTYALAIIIAAAWLIKMIAEKRFFIRRTPFDLPLLLFAGSQILSTIFSIERHTSIFGYYSRFNGGLLSIITYLFLYWALATNLDAKNIIKLLKIGLLSSLLVAIWGILEHFGIDAQYWVQNVQARVFSTLGQPNWLAAYLLVLLPLPAILAIQPNQFPISISISISKLKLFTVACSLYTILYTAFLFTFSVSAYLAFIIVFVLLFAFFLLRNFKENVKPILLLLSITFIATATFGQPLWFRAYNQAQITFNIKLPAINPQSQTASQTINQNTVSQNIGSGSPEETGKIRQIVWQGGLEIFKAYPIFGSGVETFAYSFYRYRPQELNLTTEWDFLYNKAHNEYINYLATTGLLGLGTYLLLITWFLVWFFKRFPVKRVPNSQLSIVNYALLTGYLSILITNFFGFSVVVINLLFFLIPGIIFTLAQSSKLKLQNRISNIDRSLPALIIHKPRLVIIFILLTASYLLLTTVRTWQADTAFATGYNLAHAGQIGSAFPYLEEAISLNPREPFFASEFGYTTAVLASQLKDDESTLSAELASIASYYSERAVQQAPANLNWWKNLINAYQALSEIDPSLTKNISQAYQTAIQLAPTDTKLHYNLGKFYWSQNEKERAIQTMQTVIKLKPDYREARHRLAEYLWETGQKDQARAQMQFVLEKIDPGDTFSQAKLKEWQAP